MHAVEEFELPERLRPDLERAIRLEWLSLAYLSSLVVLMYLVMGSSQAMKTAWMEDILSLIPPIAFLVSQRIRRKAPSERFPYGYHRAVTIAFLIASLALLAMGVVLLFDGGLKLVHAERPTIGSMTLLGRQVWQGWIMLPVLAWGIVPAILLGRAKHGPARRLHDKTLFADAEMNRADWLTGIAAMSGVLGIAVGWWWADATAAVIISLDIVRDGKRNLFAAVGDLMDRAPQTVDHEEPIELPARIVEVVAALPWVEEAAARVRENGHVFFGEVFIVPRIAGDAAARARECTRLIRRLDWRMLDVVVQFVDRINGNARAPRGDEDERHRV